MITLYGVPGSRAFRTIWMLEELGVPYENIPTHFATGDTKKPDYLKINPNGHIPTIVDDGVAYWESMAINLYLAKRYGGALYPAGLDDEAKTWQWSVWAISEIEPLQMQIVVQKLFTAEERRNPKVLEGAAKGLQRPLRVLDAALAGRNWLVGDHFSVADLNVASVIYLMKRVDFGYAEHANVQRWADACYARPALARALARP